MYFSFAILANEINSHLTQSPKSGKMGLILDVSSLSLTFLSDPPQIFASNDTDYTYLPFLCLRCFASVQTLLYFISSHLAFIV